MKRIEGFEKENRGVKEGERKPFEALSYRMGDSEGSKS